MMMMMMMMTTQHHLALIDKYRSNIEKGLWGEMSLLQ